jgi:phage tail protein X
MGRDTTLDDPMLRLAQATSQFFAWFELHGGPPGDGVYRASAHLLCHAATDDPSHAQAARAVLQAMLAAELPVALGARAALGEVCLQANEGLGDRLFLDAAHSLCEGIAHGTRLDVDDALCFSVIPGRVLAVHHANLQAAALLARTGQRVGEGSFIELARRAVAYSLWWGCTSMRLACRGWSSERTKPASASCSPRRRPWALWRAWRRPNRGPGGVRRGWRPGWQTGRARTFRPGACGATL